jgi:hypothetical protein
MLGEPFDRNWVDKMEDTSAGPSSSEIMHQGFIFKDSGASRFASRNRHIVRKLFPRFTIDTVSPIKCDMFQLRVIRNFGMEANCSISILLRYPQIRSIWSR